MKKSLILAASIIAFTQMSDVQAATILLNSTTFDGTESITDGNIAGLSNVGGAGDTVNGWTWGTASSAVNVGLGVFAGFNTIGDQSIRANELGGGRFNFDWGSSQQLALAQAFTVNLGDMITVTYDMGAPSAGSGAGMNLYVDTGNGTYVLAEAMGANVTGDTYQFTATGSNIRIAVRGNDGFDSNANLNFIKVESVPEPASAALAALGSLALLRRRRK